MVFIGNQHRKATILLKNLKIPKFLTAKHFGGRERYRSGRIVVPTVSWGLSQSFGFCFDGIEKNGIVAIGMIGCKNNRINFMRGYNEMLERLEPKKIIVFGTPFPEMDGNIIAADYMKSRKVVR